MGQKSHTEPGAFSQALNQYLAKVLEDNGRKDLSGRWLHVVTGEVRSHNYWGPIIKNTRTMTTNDIQVVAESFGVSPYEFVANARRHAQGKLTPLLTPYVGDSGEDFTRSEDVVDRKSAAKDRPEPEPT